MSEEEKMSVEAQTAEEQKPVSTSPIERKAANYLFKKLGQPSQFQEYETLVDWTLKMRDVIGAGQFDLQGVKDFIDWVLDVNPRSAEYMRIARNPAATMLKNIDILLKYYNAYLAGQKARTNLKRNQQKAETAKPQYKQESGKQGYLEKSDL